MNKEVKSLRALAILGAITLSVTAVGFAGEGNYLVAGIAAVFALILFVGSVI